MKLGESSPRQPGGYASFPEDEGAISDETGNEGGGGGGPNYQPPQYWSHYNYLLTHYFLFSEKGNDCKSGSIGIRFCTCNITLLSDTPLYCCWNTGHTLCVVYTTIYTVCVFTIIYTVQWRLRKAILIIGPVRWHYCMVPNFEAFVVFVDGSRTMKIKPAKSFRYIMWSTVNHFDRWK